MPYLSARVAANVHCENGCLGLGGHILELRGPGQFGLPHETWESKPKGYAAWHCSRCGFVWLKKPRTVRGKDVIPVGFWKSQTFTPYSPV
jgi:hypothetical protein